MRMRLLGPTGLRVSELCFGAMMFKNQPDYADQEEANRMVGMALEAGINFFDTADVYVGSEEILGRALGAHRHEVIVASKVFGRVGEGPNDVGLSRHHIIESCHTSLRRLGTDYIDLYQVHCFDPCTPLEITLRALDDLVRQGKVRALGCSNFSGWQLMKALAVSDRQNLERFVTLQPYYSLVCRDIENELVPLCLDQGLGILPWSPLAGGFLTGKYRRGQERPQGARRSDPDKVFLRFDEEKGFDIVEELDRIAVEYGGTVAQAALNYLLCKPGITSVIIGARNTAQLADNLKTTDWTLLPEEVARLDKLSKPYPVYPYWLPITEWR